MRKLTPILICLFAAVALCSCAQGPDTSLTSGDVTDTGGEARNFVSLTMKINDGGKFSPEGYYVILFNNEVQPIEVSNAGTFTDGIRLQIDPNIGPVHFWIHRVPSVPGPGYDIAIIARIDEYAQISADWRTVSYTFKLDDNSVIFNQYLFSRFTAHAMTTDVYQSSILGRVIDAMGPGPDITQNSEYTVFANRSSGVENPIPPDYPQDPLYDWSVKEGLAPEFPYVNFDIESFQINVF